MNEQERAGEQAPVRLEARVWGRVQGVGFRAFILREARRQGLRGAVWNGHDGAGYVVAGGRRAALWVGFASFLLLCAGSAYGVFAYATRFTTPAEAATVERHGDLLEVERAGLRDWTSVTTATLNEGDAIRTGPDTDAIIRLFDGS